MKTLAAIFMAATAYGQQLVPGAGGSGGGGGGGTTPVTVAIPANTASQTLTHNLGTVNHIMDCYDSGGVGMGSTSPSASSAAITGWTPGANSDVIGFSGTPSGGTCVFYSGSGLQGPTGATGATGANGTNGTNGAISQVYNNGSAQTVRPYLNLISGSNATVTCVDNSGATRTDCTVASTAASSGLLNHQGQLAPVTISGTTTIYTYTVPANTLGAGGCINLNFLIQHTTGTASERFDLNWGGTTVLMISSADTTPWYAPNITICNNAGVTNAQQITTPPFTYNSGNNPQPWSAIVSTAAIDTTANVVLKLTCGNNNGDAITPVSWTVWH